MINPFKKKERMPLRPLEYQKPPQPPKQSPDCEIKVKRDSEGRVIGIKRKGNCKKEDVMAFARENGLNLDE